MEVVLVYDGLGNQLSRYALYLSKKLKGQNVRCEFFSTDHNGIELDSLFGIKTKGSFLDFMLRGIWGVLYLKRWPSISRILKRILPKLGINIFYENCNFSFRPEVLEGTSNRGLTFYCGGWLNPMYFVDIKDTLKSLYTFPALDEQNEKILKEAENPTAVAIHVRGGDYINPSIYKIFGAVCTESYYKNAIEYIENTISNPRYYVFTNDPNYAKKVLAGRTCTYVCHNKGTDSWKDLALMSHFKNIIIPNSTFSWWAAYLGEERKCVLRPPVFMYGNLSSSEIYPKEWIEISNE